MADQLQPSNNQPSDEIDLGQLLQLIKNGFRGIGNFLLRVFLYLKRNSLKLIGLVALGIGISYGLSQIVSKTLKTDVIVRPNFESKNYLYDVVDEIEANIKAKDQVFLSQMDISQDDLKGFKIAVEEIEDEEEQTEDGLLNQMKYLDVLKNFKDESFVIDILRAEVSEKSIINHKITFLYKDPVKGPIVAEKLMKYINTNEYFNNIRVVHNQNTKARIIENEKLVAQIDLLVGNYSKSLVASKAKSGSEVVYMEKESALDVHLVLDLKNKLLKEIEAKKLDIAQQTGVLSIINFGKTQQVKKSFFNGTYFLIPAILVGVFLFLGFFKYLERKSKEIE